MVGTLRDGSSVTNPPPGLFNPVRVEAQHQQNFDLRLSATASAGHHLFAAAEGGVIGQFLGRPVLKSPPVGDSASNIIGVAGHWPSAWWGGLLAGHRGQCL
ncbi:hypothetical protein QQ25_22780 [Mycolicibacterium setense]|nr:hypothetical protein QQ25_22780 [Mycolicibacterium setense]